MNYYDILNVSKNATKKEIKSAYKALVKQYHPDIYSGDKSFAEQKIKEINSAYDVLSVDKLRKEYDASLAGGYEFDESVAYEEPVRYRKKESYEDFYNGSTHNNIDPENFNPKSSDLENDAYENYKKVYNDFLNKNSTNSGYDTYTRAKESYTDYYRASTYRKPSYSSNPNPDNSESFVGKKVYIATSKLPVILAFLIIYLFLIFIVLSDFQKLMAPDDPVEDTYSNYINDTPIVVTPNYYDNTTQNTTYDPYYIIDGYRVPLSDLETIYSKYYSGTFNTFDEFMTFIKDVDEYSNP